MDTVHHFPFPAQDPCPKGVQPLLLPFQRYWPSSSSTWSTSDSLSKHLATTLTWKGHCLTTATHCIAVALDRGHKKPHLQQREGNRPSPWPERHWLTLLFKAWLPHMHRELWQMKMLTSSVDWWFSGIQRAA